MTARCPSWCVQHSDDCDDLAEPGQRHTRLHEAAPAATRFQIPTTQFWVSVTVTMERYDVEGVPGPVAVRLLGTEECHANQPQFDAGLNNTMAAEDVTRFAEMLLAVVAANGQRADEMAGAR